MHLCTTKTKEVMEKLFGKTREEYLKQMKLPMELNHRTYEQNYPYGVFTHNSSDGSSSTVTIGLKSGYYAVRFTLSYYPACCGSRLFHTFEVNDRVTQEQLDELLNTFFAENKWIERDDYTSMELGRSNRIEVVMVEKRPVHPYGRDEMAEPEPVAAPKMQYQTLWNFFHKNARRVRTRLELNANTGNILHNMEVLL